LNAGHGVFCIPLPGAGVEHLEQIILSGTRGDASRERLIIGTTEDPKEVHPPFYGIGTMYQSILEQNAAPLVETVRKKSTTGGVLTVLSVSQLEGMYASDTNRLLERLASRISNTQRRSVDAVLLLIQSDSKIRSSVVSMCREYVRFFVKDRSVVLMGEKPSTEAMVLEHSPENPILPRLTKIV